MNQNYLFVRNISFGGNIIAQTQLCLTWAPSKTKSTIWATPAAASPSIIHIPISRVGLWWAPGSTRATATTPTPRVWSGMRIRVSWSARSSTLGQYSAQSQQSRKEKDIFLKIKLIRIITLHIRGKLPINRSLTFESFIIPVEPIRLNIQKFPNQHRCRWRGLLFVTAIF